jgi:WD40 repeat protein
VPVYAVGQDRGVHYYVMQLIDGDPLTSYSVPPHAALLASTADSRDATGTYHPEAAGADSTQAARTNGPTPGPRTPGQYRTIAGWVRQAADALHHAHECDIVHRDVKPGNLLLDRSGHLWVVDFGLAKLPGSDLTGTADVMGTVRYMSPEQASGRAVTLDGRSDVYSLGVTLYELLTRGPAFEADDRRELLRQVLEAEPPLPRKRDRTVPPELDTICRTAMAKDPAERYQSAAAFRDDLQRFLDDRPITAKPPTLTQRGHKWLKRNRVLVGALAAVVLAVAAAGMVALAVSREAIATTQLETEKALVGERSARASERQTAYRHGIALAHREWQAGNATRANSVLDTCPEEHRSWEWNYLAEVARPELVVIPTEDTPNLLRVTADGRIFARVGDALRVWSVETGALQTGPPIIAERGSHFTAVSADGNCVLLGRRTAHASEANTTRYDAELYDGRSGQRQRVISWAVTSGGSARATGAASPRTPPVSGWFSPDGRRLALLGHDDATVRLVDVPTGRVVAELRHQSVNPRAVCFNTAGTQLLTAQTDNTVRWWNTQDGTLAKQWTPPGNVGSVTRLAVSPHDDRISVCTELGMHMVLMPGDRGEIRHYKLSRSGITNLVYRPDGYDIAMTFGDHAIEVRTVTRLETHTIPSHSAPVVELAYTADGTRLVSAARDRTVRVFDATSPSHAAMIGRLTPTEREMTYPLAEGVAISHDGTRVAVHTHTPQLAVMDVATGRLLVRLDPVRDRHGAIHAVAFGSDDRTLIAVCTNAVLVVNAASGVIESERAASLATSAFERHWGGDDLSGYRRGRIAAVFPDGRRFLAVDPERHLVVSAVPPHAAGHLWADREIVATAVAVDGRGRAAAYCERRRRIQIYEPSGLHADSIPVASPVVDLVFSPGGQVLVAACVDGTLCVFDPASGAMLARLESSDQQHHVPAFSTDGTRMILGLGADDSRVGGIKVWDTSSWQELLVIPFASPVEGVAFTPDGSGIVALDHSQFVWHLDARPRTREEKARIATARREPWHQTMARVSEQYRYPHAAAFHLTQLLRSSPGDPDLVQRHNVSRVRASGNVGELTPAEARVLEQSLSLLSMRTAYQLAAHYIQTNDAAGYRRVCDRLLNQLTPASADLQAMLVYRLCALGAGGPADHSALTRAASARFKNSPSLYLRHTAPAFLLYRDGKYDDARRELLEAATHESKSNSRALVWLFRAMTEYQLGNRDEARKWLAKADEWNADRLTQIHEESTPLEFQVAIPFPLLRNEAAKLLGVK